MTKPRRFSVRRHPNGRSEFCFEVVDLMSGTVVASGLGRADAETEAHRRSHGGNGEAAGLAGLLVAIDAFLAETGDYSRNMVARAALALDELREELARTDRIIVEQQTRLEPLYKLTPDPDSDA